MDKFSRIDRIITRNPAKFSGRSKITHAWLQKTFDWMTPGLATANRLDIRDAHKFVSTYTTINSVLAKRGLYLKARHYYRDFQLCNTKPTVDAVVSTYKTASTAKKERATALRQGYYKHAGTWDKLTPDELTSFKR